MLELVSNYDQDIKFVMGFAGSGKSTELVKRADENTLVLTPTHKAAGVLIDKGIDNVYTIHSVLKLVPTINENYVPGKHRMQKLQRIGDTDLSKIKTVFIDEFGMLNQEIMDMLLEVLPEDAEVVVFGDPYQLPPVDGEPIEPEIYTNNIKHLTTQHRAEAPEVVETFMRFMNFIKDGSEMDLKLNKGIKKGTLDDFNPDTDRALAFTNRKVGVINSKIAKILGKTESFMPGDELFANQMECTYSNGQGFTIYPNCISKGRLMDSDKLQETAMKTNADIEKYNTQTILNQYSKGAIVVDGVEYGIYYDTNHYLTQYKLKNDIDKWQAYVYNHNNIPEDTKLARWCSMNRNAKGVRERGKAWSNFLAHSNLVFNLQRPYATTVHKAQGSEFSTVYIDQNDIKQSIRNGHYVMYARLMYVALSRAINKIIII